MKKCPTCDRTFDDTMSFCLVDGSVLSAPFDPGATESVPASRNTDPGQTRILYPAQNTAEATQPGQKDIAPPSPPQTIASSVSTPSSQRETALPVADEHSAVEEAPSQSAMKTMMAPAPELISKGILASSGQRPAASASTETHSSAGKRVMFIAGSVLVVIIVGAIVWLIRDKIRSAPPSNAPSKQTNQAANRPQVTSQPFTENVSGTQIQMVSVPGGTFLMGSPLSEAGRDQDEGPQNEVTVQSFSIGKYEVTQEQYKAVMGTNPSSFIGDDLPVDSVSWNDAVAFCRKLSQMTGREYRLPTEAEWEYACRAKTTGPFPGNVDAVTWYDANSGNRTHPVGQKEPNGFGLYDMNGNVWEWCQSKYKPYPYRADDGREDLQSTDVRVMRGGSWRSPQKGCRSAYRRRVPPDDRTIGFRIILPAR
jgi:formylglycine-generating enzyme required for sulfatase activity